jgi:flavin-dependent dehydrogenase
VVNEVDALIVGAGPAGSTAALNLAPCHKVLLVDSRDIEGDEEIVGESLAPAARRLLSDMGLLKSFEAEEHQLCYGNRFVWGGTTPSETDHLRTPDGPGWHLDRSRFDGWLRGIAIEWGARLLSRAVVRSFEWDTSNQCWQTEISHNASQVSRIQARILIDATGRHASISRRLGATVVSREPRLVCGWLIGYSQAETSSTAGFTFVEAVEDGWWYTAPLPSGRRILALYTDPALPQARVLRSTEMFLKHSSCTEQLHSILDGCGFSTDTARPRLNVANGGALQPPAGSYWFATGDAAIHFDPISSQGLLNALFTGLATAEAADRALAGDDPLQVAEMYCHLIDGVGDAYKQHLTACYGSEERWPELPFWARRRTFGQDDKIPINAEVTGELPRVIPQRAATDSPLVFDNSPSNLGNSRPLKPG